MKSFFLPDVFKYFLKILFRSFSKNIIYVLINILGLGLALAVCLVAYLNYRFDRDFDSCHVQGDRIFRIEFKQSLEVGSAAYANTPRQLGPAILEDISGIEKMARVNMDLMSNVQELKAGNNETYTRLIYADPEFLEIFSFPLLAGSRSAFNNNSIFITRNLAISLFGDQNPMGEIIFHQNTPYTVEGILKNHPLNSSFSFQAILPINHSVNKQAPENPQWSELVSSTFILLANVVQAETIEKSLQLYLPAINKVSWRQLDHFYLAPFTKMAHNGRSIEEHPFRPSVHPAAVLPPLIAAISILLIACFNFIITNISMAGKRLKEIGIKKVFGSQRSQLSLQFLLENILLISLALVFALFFAHYLVPAFSNMWDFISISFLPGKDSGLWSFFFLILLSTAFLAGAYPAFFIGSFNPQNIFQGNLKLKYGNWFSKILLVLQFSIASLALFTGAVFFQNTAYQKGFDMGIDGESLIEVHGEHPDLMLFKDAVQNLPGIKSISKSIPGSFFKARTLKNKDCTLEADMHLLELESFSCMGFRLIAGRPFEARTKASDEKGSIVVNRKFVEVSGLKEPIGASLIMNDSIPLSIIGIIENILDEGVFTSHIPPAFYRLANDSALASALCFRVSPDQREEIRNSLEEIWNMLHPDHPFLGIEGNIYAEVSAYINRNILVISLFLIFLAVLISVSGLYSMLSLVVIHRTKELGIRKIAGATTLDILKVLGKEFLFFMAAGFFLGLISAYYLNIRLMNTIWVYYTNITALEFILPILILSLISLAAVGGKLFYAARQNPADSLKYE